MIRLHDVSFAERDPSVVKDSIIGVVEGMIGRTLSRADPLRLFLEGVALVIVQQREIIDHAAKMNLLAYATGDFLEHIGILVGVTRIPAPAAVTTLEFSMQAPRVVETVIPKGTRVTAGDGVHFATNDTARIPAGDTSISVPATCTVTGTVGNGYAEGEITTITDPVPFIAAVTNLTETEGGANTEADEAFRERIAEAPEAFGTAGSAGAYRSHAMSANANIADVSVENGGAGVVRVIPLLIGGEIPGEEILQEVADVLSADRVRPLTDNVQVVAPQTVSYDIDLQYWVSSEDASRAEGIRIAVSIPEQTGAYIVRTLKPPKKSVKVYKVFTVAPDGKPTALFVAGTEELPQGVSGEVDYYKMVRQIAKYTRMSVKDAKEMLRESRSSRVSRHRFFRHTLRRTGAEGFEKDMAWALRHYVNSAIRYASMEQEFKPDAIALYESMYGSFKADTSGLKGNDKFLAQYTKNYINDINGNPTLIEEQLNNWLNNTWILRTSLYRRMASVLRLA